MAPTILPPEPDTSHRLEALKAKVEKRVTQYRDASEDDDSIKFVTPSKLHPSFDYWATHEYKQLSKQDKDEFIKFLRSDHFEDFESLKQLRIKLSMTL